MNCELFEDVARDLARNRIMEVEKREGAKAHAEACDRCAARLLDERSLTEGLRALSARLQDRQAPPRVEAALLNTFRERSISQRANAAMTEPSIPSVALVDDIKRPGRVWRVAAGIAAAIMITAIVSAIALKPSPVPEMPEPDRQASLAPGPAIPENSHEQKAPTSPEPEAATGPRNGDGPVAKLPRHKRPRGSQASKRPQADAREAESTTVAEVATEFMPLTYGGPSPQMASGQIVRVELPRSAMASFGLPVNHERAESRVKADVLIGEDGLARAIRFVR
jgi:hypothetical protein